MSLRVVVDLELCSGHGVCEREAPEIFRVVVADDGYAQVEVLLPQPPPALHDAARRAIGQCPNQVITLEED